MSRGVSKIVSLKSYTQHQTILFPSNLDEWIAENHVVRTVSSAIDKLPLDILLKGYDGGGAAVYHPKMMLKLMIFGYVEKAYSSRQIAKMVRESICFRWLSSGQMPDHRTINDFRLRMKEIINDIFSEILEMLIEVKLVDLKKYFVDGTKIESASNRYTFVWAKNIETYQGKLQENIKSLLKEIDLVNDKENTEYGTKDLAETGGKKTVREKKIDEVEVEKYIEHIKLKLSKKAAEKAAEQASEKVTKKKDDKKSDEEKKLEKSLKILSEDYSVRLKKYNAEEKLLNGRGSYSKTDIDATFMRMKDDHMGNGQLKPAYNIQVGSEDQFITGFSVHQSPGDAGLLKTHLEHVKAQQQKRETIAEEIIADAAYGSEENYEYLEDNKAAAYVKYPDYYAGGTKKRKEDIFHRDNLYYNEADNYFVCPMGQHMKFVGTRTDKTTSGFQQTSRTYRAQNCQNCPLHSQCHKGKKEREIGINDKLNDFKDKARERLATERGIMLKKKRGVEIESVYGQIKSNREFKRFRLRSLAKVNIEVGLLAIAHNLAKKFAVETKKDKEKAA